VELFQ